MYKMVDNKRGQITLFIIIGIVLLIVIGVFFLLRTSTVGKEESVPVEFEPVKLYLEECVSQIAEKAIVLVGEQGGYIDPSSEGVSYNSVNPTEGSGIMFTSLVPYWFFLSSPNTCNGDCRFDSFQPWLYKENGEPSIQSQIEKYVQDNIGDCISDFTSLKQYVVSEEGEFSVESIIANDEVILNVEYPLLVEYGNSKTRLRYFTTDVKVSLPKMYEMGTTIAKGEMDNCLLEHEAIELITAFSGIDKERLPPQMGVSMGSASVFWIERNVKEKVEDMLQSYMPLIRFVNANNYREIKVGKDVPNSEIINAFYKNMVLPFDASGLNVDVMYLTDWPTYFSLGKGSVIRSTGITVPFIGFGIQKYGVGYDLSYPVIVKLNDPTAFNGKGYSFNIALEGNMRNNFCMESDFDQTEFPGVNDNSMLCDENKRNSAPYNITVFDDFGSPVGGAFITFSSEDSCPISETDSDGNFYGTLPVGYGAITIEHPDFLGYTRPIKSELSEGEFIQVEMPRKREIKFDVLKKSYRKQPGWAFTNFELPLEIDENAIITFTRISEGLERSYATTVTYSGTDSVSNAKESVELYPGTYDVNIQIFANSEDYPVRIPPDKRKIGGGFFSGDEEVWIPDKEIIMTAWQSGGVILDSVTGRWSISSEELDELDFVTFYVTGFERQYITKIEDLELPSKISDITTMHRSSLEPMLVKK